MAAEIRDLIERAAAGEKKAWDSLVKQYSPLVWGILGKFRNLSPAEKEDLFQDVFVALLNRGLRSFHGSTEHEFRWYLKTITENEAKSYLRRRGRRLEVLDPFLPGEEEEEKTLSTRFPFADPAPGPERVAAGQEVFRRVRLCLKDIPAVDQEIFWMEVRGYPDKEIAKVLGLPMGTVASKYHRAKEKIEECLRKAGIL